MHRIALVIAAVCLLLIGFGSGYWYRSVHVPVAAEMEDYALSNILEDVGYDYYLAKGDTAEMRELLDVNLHAHLSRVRENQGAIDYDVFRAAKIRTLNALANLWQEQPPFTSEQWRENDTNKSWWGEWQQARTKNAELLRWAKDQCAAAPSLKCNSSSNRSVEPPVNPK